MYVQLARGGSAEHSDGDADPTPTSRLRPAMSSKVLLEISIFKRTRLFTLASDQSRGSRAKAG